MISCAFNLECNSGYLMPLLYPVARPGGIVVSGSVCPLVCVSVSTQNGSWAFSFDQVGLGASVTTGWANSSICNKDDVSLGGSVMVGIGAYYSQGLKNQRLTNNRDFGVGVGVGAAVTAGASKTAECGRLY